jgi:demethylmenaquinone methyltransferase/2-methoxy-6-polyprenyl-1,4-benzoquinol methylase
MMGSQQLEACDEERTTVDKSAARVRDMFGEIAGRYDFLNHLLSLNADRYWRWRTVRKVAPQGTGPILDLCTGTGDLALAYFRASDETTRIVGADFCHEMLEIGRDKGEKAGANGRLSFVEADALQLPFPEDYFQIVSVAFGLRNVSDTMRGLAEMVRVCRAGGRVAVLEFSQPRVWPLGAIYRAYFRYVLPRIGQALARNRHAAYNYLPQSVGEFASGAKLAEMLSSAGLREVSFHPMTLGVATLYVGTK